MGRPRKQVAQPTEGFIAGFPGDDWHPIYYCLLFHYFHSEITVTITELVVRPVSAPGNLRRGPGYIWDPPKAWTISPTDQF